MAPTKCSKRVKDDDDEEDHFSQLPNSVALYILSFLSMKDAARTSALSKYWRRQWLCADFFDFDAYRVFQLPGTISIPQGMDILKHDAEYIEWVSNVLRVHREAVNDDGKPLVLSKLRIHMRLLNKFQKDIDEWLSYAIARKVQSLELDVILSVGYLPSYSFSGRFPRGTDFTCLRSLSLLRVSVDEGVISSFLRKFPFLERLKVVCSNTLKSLTVCGSSLALRYLEITCCWYLEHLIVRDTSLVSLTIDVMKGLVLVNNPKLVVVSAISWRWSLSRLDDATNVLGLLSSCLSRLQILEFNTAYVDPLEAIDKVPRLREVKQLTLNVDPLLEDSLIRLAALLSLSPKLEKIALKFSYVERYPKNCEKKMVLSTVSQRFPVKQRVKVVELRGYYGDVAEDEALMYVLNHTVAPPGRVIFDPQYASSFHRANKEIRTSVEKRVELLKRVLPSSVELELSVV